MFEDVGLAVRGAPLARNPTFIGDQLRPEPLLLLPHDVRDAAIFFDCPRRWKAARMVGHQLDL
jgi:hypothetical protein